MQPVTRQQSVLSALILKGFFVVVKVGMVCLLLLAAVLVLSQTAVAPVSSRLLGMYAVEYTAKAVKPCRPFFPRPYLINLEEETR